VLIKYSPDKLDSNADDKEFKGPLLKDLFEGYVEVKVPSYPERLRFPKDIGLEVAAGPVSDADKEKIAGSLRQLELLAKCAEKVKPFIASVSLKHIEDGVELKSADDLYDFPDAGGLVTGLCTKFILGFLEKKT
jgi:hypothetical protein